MYPRRKSIWRSRLAFTLVEVTVVIVIIAVLSTLAFALFRSSKEAANRTRCVGNLRQIHVAMQSFAAEHEGKLPPPVLVLQASPTGDDAESAPFFETLDHYIATARDEKAPSVWVCPADTRKWEPDTGRCSYGMNPRPVPGFYFRKEDGMTAFSPFPFSPTAIEPLSRVVFLADTGGSPVAEYLIVPSARNEPPLNLGLRHGSRDSSPDVAYSSSAQMKRDGGRANFLFFDGHVETLGYEEIKQAAWSSQP